MFAQRSVPARETNAALSVFFDRPEFYSDSGSLTQINSTLEARAQRLMEGKFQIDLSPIEHSGLFDV